MHYKVLVHNTVNAYISELRTKSKTNKSARILLKNILKHVDLLKNNGTQLTMPYAKHIEGSLWELRPGNNRIFYAFCDKNTFILLHYFHKKTQKTPPKEIEQAKRILQGVLK